MGQGTKINYRAKTQIKFDPEPLLEACDGIRFDFVQGVRLSAPETLSGKYEALLYDDASDMLLERLELRPGEYAQSDRYYFVKWRMEILKDGKSVFVHHYDCAGKKVYIVIPDGALGDNLAWVPMAEEFRQKYAADVTCACSTWMQELCADLYPALSFASTDNAVLLSKAYAGYVGYIFAEEVCHHYHPQPHQILGMQGSVQASLGLDIKPVKCRLHLGSKRPFPEKFVCISTMGKNPSKNWNYPDGWNIIIRKLRDCGYRVLDIDRETEMNYTGEPYKYPSEAEDFTGAFTLQERINLLEHADFFIGLSSGLSWLAWNCNVPVVMISGFTMPVCEFPTPYRIFNRVYCHGCWNDSNIEPTPNYCPRHLNTPREVECTKVITPQMVWNEITKIPSFTSI